MPVTFSSLADPPAEDLDSLEPVSRHSFQWKPRPIRSRGRSPHRSTQPPPQVTDVDSGASATDLDSRLTRLEEVVRDCALVLRSNVANRLDKLENSLDSETARLDARVHEEAKRRCRLLTEVAQKVSAAIDQMRLEKRSA